MFCVCRDCSIEKAATPVTAVPTMVAMPTAPSTTPAKPTVIAPPAVPVLPVSPPSISPPVLPNIVNMQPLIPIQPAKPATVPNDFSTTDKFTTLPVKPSSAVTFNPIDSFAKSMIPSSPSLLMPPPLGPVPSQTATQHSQARPQMEIPGITGFWIWQPNSAAATPLFAAKSSLSEKVPLKGTINEGPIPGSGIPIVGHVIVGANQPDDLTLEIENGSVKSGDKIGINNVEFTS